MGVIIIAEAGVNHNGNINNAIKLIDIAADAGADYVKFQTFIAKNLVSKDAQKAEYQKKNLSSEDSSQLAMLKKLELSESDHHTLIAHCKKRNINFLSTAFDPESLEFLKKLQLDLWKIPSGEITNLPYLEQIGGLNERVIISSGMATLPEIKQAINVLTSSGTDRKNITVLHCTTEYPAPLEEVNLKAMLNIKDSLSIEVGYSDHTKGITIPIAATAMGATVIEKHFTIDNAMEGPDHKASLEPTELKAMVQAIRDVELALGSKIKKPSPSELKNKAIARKSIHLDNSLKKGDRISAKDLVMMRPGDGISPMEIYEIIGKTCNKDLGTHYKLRWEDLE